jgi:hypothetical protein
MIQPARLVHRGLHCGATRDAFRSGDRWRWRGVNRLMRPFIFEAAANLNGEVRTLGGLRRSMQEAK